LWEALKDSKGVQAAFSSATERQYEREITNIYGQGFCCLSRNSCRKFKATLDAGGWYFEK